MKIDFVTIGGLQESELAGSIEALHGPHWLAFVLLHLSLHAANMILQSASRMLEGIIDGK